MYDVRIICLKYGTGPTSSTLDLYYSLHAKESLIDNQSMKSGRSGTGTSDNLKNIIIDTVTSM